MIKTTKETERTFNGKTLKVGDRVLARMRISFTDLSGNRLPDEILHEAKVSRIENDEPSFVAVNPYDDKSMELRQFSMPFVQSKDELTLWSWTWAV